MSMTLSPDFAALLLDSSEEILLLVEPASLLIRAANRQACLRLGYGADELAGKPVTEIGCALTDVFYWEEVRAGNVQEIVAAEGLYQCADGSLFPVEKSIRRVVEQGREWLVIRAVDASQEMQEKDRLAMATAQLRTTLEATADGILVRNQEGAIVNMNRRFTELWQLPEDLLGRAIDDEVLGFMADSLNDPAAYRQRLDAISELLDEDTLDLLELKNGRVLEQKSRPHYLEERIIGRVFTYADLTERKRAEWELRIAANAFESQEAMLVTDANQVILKVNRAFTEVTGYSAEEAVGKTPSLLNSGRQSQVFYEELWQTLTQKNYWQGEIWNRRKNGEIYPEWLTITAVLDDGGQVTNYVATFSDITKRKQSEDEIRYLAFYDQLTSLPNRRLLQDRLRHALAGGARSHHQGALLLIDLDHFKTLNDTLGHDIGDLLLQEVAQRLVTCVREGDTVARLGGDEFVVMLEGLSATPGEAANQTEVVGEKVLAALNQPYQLAGYEHHSTPSIGAVLFTDQHDSVDDLLKQADLAMYQAKSAGRNTLRFFDPQMQAVVTARSHLEHDLRQGLQKGQFLLHYQPQVDASGRATGVEALVRWLHPVRGLVSPAEFIPLAEDTGLILPLGQWVLESACAQQVLWAARPETAALTVAVNVSARQFRHPDFVAQVMAVLDRAGANPQRIKLELTESLLVDNVEEVIAKMTALKERGVSFSLDDFGTGYSSLAYLKRLPLDQLKIDQSFVRDLLTDPNDAAIASTIVALGRSLGLAVIAEGVETEAQRDFLAQSGCASYQGYLYSRPLPPAELEAFLLRS